jgi:hypothetical protein
VIASRPSTFNSEQSIQAYALASDIVTNLYLMGIGERNIARHYSDFHSPPTDSELRWSKPRPHE